MATIEKRKSSTGATTYRASIRLKQGGVIWHRETQTFPKQAQAKAWAQRREVELKTNGPESALVHGKSVGQMVLAYRDLVDQGNRPLNRNKRWCLERIAKSFDAVPASELTAKKVVDYMIERRDEGAGPSTCQQEFIYLRVALRDAHHVLGFRCAWSAPDEAKPVLKSMGLIKKSNRRTRRLEGDEEPRLEAYFAEQDAKPKVGIPMLPIMRFAIDTCMRQAEICGITWSDLDEAKRTVVVRDRKDPQDKEGRDETIPLLGRAWDIVQSQPRVQGEPTIFPFKPASVGARFTVACQRLRIDNLHFHDLRREGATRWLEKDMPAPRVILLTGHRDWNQFARYVGLRPEDLHRYC